MSEHAAPRSGWIPLAILVVALTLRVAFLFGHPMPLRSDELDYDQLGWTLARTGTYSMEGHPTAYRAIGYPAVLAAVYAVAGRNPAAAKLVQVFLDAGTALLLYFLFSRRNRTAGLLVGLTWAAFPAAILFASQLFSESVSVFALVLFACVLDRIDLNGREFPWVAGLLLGGLVLVRPFLALFALSIPIAFHRTGAERRILAVVTLACLPVALWIGRNALVMHAPVLTTSTGVNLLIGNNPIATGGYSRVDSASVPTVDGSETRADSAATRAAASYAAEHPYRTLSTALRKVLLLLTSEGELVVGNFAEGAGNAWGRFRDRFRPVPLWIHLLVSLPSALILILGTLGLATRRSDLVSRLFYALLLTTLVSTVIFFGGSRFRFPLMPFLSGFAAEVIAAPKARLRAFTRTRLALVVAACSVYIVVWAGELYLMRVLR